MRKSIFCRRSDILLSVAVLFLFGPAVKAQSITITPSYPGVQVRTSVQLTAKAMGLSPNTVTWAVNGILGGNATVGTISQTGLYQAPAAVPPQTRGVAPAGLFSNCQAKL